LSASPPRRDKRSRIFYGWYIIGVTALGGIFSGGTSQAFFGIFVTTIEDDTEWSRTSIAGVVTLATLVGGGVSAFIGVLADRYGPRKLMAIGAVLYVAGYTSMIAATQLWQLYLAYFTARMAALQTMSGVVPRTAAVNWFRRMRGRALGFQVTSQPLGGALMAAIAGVLLTSGVAWRDIFFGMGIAAAIVLLPPIVLVVRRQPEDMGLLADGDLREPDPSPSAAAAPATRRRRPHDAEVSWTLRQALATKAFWLVSIATLFNMMASGGISFNLAAYFDDLGFGRGYAAAAASVFLFSGAFSASVWGFLTERFEERTLVVIATIAAALLTLYGRFVFEPVGGLLFAAGYGATTRGEGALVMMLLAAYYGRRSFGAISGFASSFSFVGLGVGPVFFSRVFEVRGSYDDVYLLATAVLTVSAAMMYLASRPTLPAASGPGPAAETGFHAATNATTDETTGGGG
jgi:sugar phosphate permease